MGVSIRATALLEGLDAVREREDSGRSGAWDEGLDDDDDEVLDDGFFRESSTFCEVVRCEEALLIKRKRMTGACLLGCSKALCERFGRARARGGGSELDSPSLGAKKVMLWLGTLR